MEILEVRDLSFAYGRNQKNTIENISFSLEKGDFVAVCGATGSGKSTLLRMLKRELRPLGTLNGGVYFKGVELRDMDIRVSATKIGFVMQRPEQQIVTDKVWHELAFGLENLGVERDVIRRRVSEMAAYFGIESWFEKNVNELSGGQKQLLNLASVMVMQPEILVLDEPTAQLDPIASSDFIATLAKLNRELGLTVVIAEHRLEELVPVSNKVLALEKGKIYAWGKTRDTMGVIAGNGRLFGGMPAAVRLASALGENENCPLTVGEGRNFIENNFEKRITSIQWEDKSPEGETVLEFSDVFFRYQRELPDVLRGLSFEVRNSEIFCILGGNGSGKSTALLCAAGIKRNYGGNIRVLGKPIGKYKGQSLYDGGVALLPQDAQTLFLCNTVAEELADAGVKAEELPFDLSGLLELHPYDLSGGQQQLLALAKVLAAKPRILLADEPTKGLDSAMKKVIIDVFRRLKADGTAVVTVSHDVEFAAECADRCAMFFRGEITSCDVPRKFFADNSFYTTAANRMTRNYYSGIVSIEDAVEVCRINGRKSK
ncbi:MAG: ATP-binding cassette domain-containing protein [Clostridia bacterium]|nr:ATP-binding cassette domain-containing protein [Clostridia bacterium]